MKIATGVVKKAGYETGKSIVDDVTFEVHEGEQIGVIGPNGAGKSTSIKAMIGFLKRKRERFIGKTDIHDTRMCLNNQSTIKNSHFMNILPLLVAPSSLMKKRQENQRNVILSFLK